MPLIQQHYRDDPAWVASWEERLRPPLFNMADTYAVIFRTSLGLPCRWPQRG